MCFTIGVKCYIIISNSSVEEVEIVDVRGGFYTIVFGKEKTIIRVKRHRLYLSYDEAVKVIEGNRQKKETRLNPWGV